MNNEHGNKLEQRIRFVAKRYREGSLDPDKAWQKFASEHAISRKVSFRRYWIGAAAVVLVLVGLGTWFTVERNAPDWVAITTAPGQMVKLSDMAGRGDLALLQQIVERTVLLVDKCRLDADDFYVEELAEASHPCTLEDMERQFIAEVLKEKKGNLTLAAQQLDISRQTLYNKMRKYGL